MYGATKWTATSHYEAERRLFVIPQYTLASLFDGIGGFPYAASFYNITSLWASEIVPACVSVTKRHFPDMTHAGDVTQLHGGKLPPVDMVTFGSPCQGYPEEKNIPKF